MPRGRRQETAEVLSLIRDSDLSYPSGKHYFSPDTAYPEYALGHVSPDSNPVYEAVRRCFMQAGLDVGNFDTPSWNPLRTSISQGSKVFLLCNFVLDRQRRETAEGFEAKCLHASVLRAVADYVLLAVGDGGRVSFGNSPMQHADWSAVLEQTGAQRVVDFYRSKAIAVDAKDLRLFVVRRNRSGALEHVERRPDADGIAVDLGADSLLTDLGSNSSPRYRVMNYSPVRLQRSHGPHGHSYVIHREIMDADVVFSLPKLKTHEKVGMTCVMKNCVGTVGHKDSLPHHRFGCPEIGGDEYPVDPHGVLHLASAFHDRAQATYPGTMVGNVARVADRAVRLAVGRRAPILEGAWWGNDTTWRMVVDLARIVSHGDQDGKLHSEPCRAHLALVDGIIGGEGEGPLSPSPVHSGLLLFADNPLLADYACALMMGFEPSRLPTVSRGLNVSSFPLFGGDIGEVEVVLNGRRLALPELAEFAEHHYRAPNGWEGVL